MNSGKVLKLSDTNLEGSCGRIFKPHSGGIVSQMCSVMFCCYEYGWWSSVLSLKKNKQTNKHKNNKKIMITVETFSCAGNEISVNPEHLPYNFIHHRYLRLYGSSFRWNLNFLENVWEQTKKTFYIPLFKKTRIGLRSFRKIGRLS